MIDYMIGKVFRKNGDSTTILVNGIGYEVFIPFCYYKSYEKNQEIELDIVHIQKEDGRETLYGFFDFPSKSFFRSLLTVDGIGDKKAFTMLANNLPSDLIDIVNKKDLNAFKKVKGIGPKTGQKIIETLAGKIEMEDVNPVFTEAKNALLILGLSDKETVTFLDSLDKTVQYRLEELITMALRKE